MIDLTEAFAEGIELARVSDQNKKEILGVFEAVKDQLLEFTGNRVSFRTRRASPADIDLSMTSRYGGTTEVLELLGNAQSFVIGKILIADLGYPCYLVFSGHTVQIADKEALTSVLGDLFKTHVVGSILYNLSKLDESGSD